MQVGQTIYNQLGAGRFSMMTGSKQFVTDTNMLRMKLIRNTSGAGYLQITLDADDTYTMHFYRIYKLEVKTVTTYSGVYCDMLQEIFTEVTGLYTKF